MKLAGKSWTIPAAVFIIVVIASQFHSFQLISKAKTLSKNEVRSQLETMYAGGKVDSIKLNDEVYVAGISRKGSQYKAEIDKESGEVLTLIQTKKSPIASAVEDSQQEVENDLTGKPIKGVTPPSVSDKTRADSSSTTVPEEKKTVRISEKQVVEIALAQLSGEVKDVEFYDKTDGGYYMVEIEADVSDGPDEATYQIHAVSGKVMTVTWDD